MRSRAVRVTLTLLVVAAFGAAAYFSWTIHTLGRAERQAAAAFDQTRITALRDAYELRATQQGYVAAGQNETFWFGKVTELVESLRAAITTLKSATISPAALAFVESAAAALGKFEQADGRARNYAAGGQKLLASDVIFSNGLDAAVQIATALEQAGFALSEASQAAEAERTRQLALAAGGSAAFAILALLLLTPMAAAAAETPVATVQENAFGADSLRLREDVKPPERRPATSRDNRDAARRRVAPPSATPSAATAASATTSSVGMPSIQAPLELQGLAAVCTDLARLSDTSMLPGILERAAAALDASGLVLWIADQDGRRLVPIATHGYPASVVSRMGTLQVDGENATAAAFRTGLLQTVSGTQNSSGAIAVPLLASAGCRGVMSAEIRTGAHKYPARLAAASILAAQLASLLGPPAAAEDRNSAAL